MKTPENVQSQRRAILIIIKNGFQDLIEKGWRQFKPVYDDLQNFLYGIDPFTKENYMVSTEELEYYEKLYRDAVKMCKDAI